jgi:threonine aldolase
VSVGSTTAGDGGRRYVELRSDTFTLPTAEMLQAMVTAPLGDDVYAEDPTVRELEELSARTLGKEAACLMPSGTMSNLACLMAHCRRGSTAIVGEESDIYIYEAGGASVCGGVVYHPVPNERDGSLALDAIAASFPPDPEDPQFATPALLCLENPQNRCGGKILSMSYLDAVTALAREKGLPVHMDGARIFNAALSSGVAVDDIAAHADSLQFCLSKGLGAPVGSVVVGTAAFVRSVRRVRKMLGGGMRQAGVLAAAGIVALNRRGRVAVDHELARRLAVGLAAIPGIVVDTVEGAMNMVFFRVVAPGWETRPFLAALRTRGVSLAELRPGQIRSVTHHGIDAADIDYTLDTIRSVLEFPPDRSAPARRSHVDHDSVLAS